MYTEGRSFKKTEEKGLFKPNSKEGRGDRSDLQAEPVWTDKGKMIIASTHAKPTA